MLLEIRDLKIDFLTDAGSVRALDGVSFSIERGQTVCLVGESGSGKSITALSIGRLLPSPPAIYVGGEIVLDGRSVLQLNKQELRKLRGRVVNYIFQEPGASFNPVYRVGTQILETLRLHRREAATEAEVIRLLKQVHISAPEMRVKAFPHQLSGGMQQRVMIAMALASNPQLLIADEPTTALDVTVQAEIMDLLRELKQSLGMSILLITHNLHLVKDIADRVLVMYAGQVVEAGPVQQILFQPKHPYTKALLEAVPTLGLKKDQLQTIPGGVPHLGGWPSGCRFHPRCSVATPECSTQAPGLTAVGPDQVVRCPYVSS